MKHLIDSNDSCFYIEAIDLIVDDYVYERMHNKPFQELLNDCQVEGIPSLHNKD